MTGNFKYDKRIHSFNCSFQKYSLSTSCVPSTILGAKTVNRISKLMSFKTTSYLLDLENNIELHNIKSEFKILFIIYIFLH